MYVYSVRCDEIGVHEVARTGEEGWLSGRGCEVDVAYRRFVMQYLGDVKERAADGSDQRASSRLPCSANRMEEL